MRRPRRRPSSREPLMVDRPWWRPPTNPSDSSYQVGWVGAVIVQSQWPEFHMLREDWAGWENVLAAAYEQCCAFINRDPGEAATSFTGPWVASNPRPWPFSWELAQIAQTRAIYRAQQANADDGMGDLPNTVTVFPMDWTVKNLLRPKKGLRYAR